MTSHAVQHLFEQSKRQSTRPYIGRGSHNNRCADCRQPPRQCLCELRPRPEPSASFVLIMYKEEVFKPSNTGWLIADVVADTSAYNWSRTEPDPALLAQLKNPVYQPFVVFPGDYAEPERPVYLSVPTLPEGKRPLYVLLDGSWREARKMFRKSDYLNEFPLLSFSPEVMSRFALRTAAHKHQLATAEVAAQVLALQGYTQAAQRLDTWFDCYTQASLSEARKQRLKEKIAEPI